MLPCRFVSLILLMLAVQVWCKPAKSTEDEYSDDDPPSEYNDDDVVPDDDNQDDSEPPRILSKPKVIHERSGSTIVLPCNVEHTENHVVTWKKDDELLYSEFNSFTPDSKRIVRLMNNTLIIYNATVNDSSNNYECSILSTPPITITHRLLIDPERVAIPSPQAPKSLIRVTPAKRVEVSAGETVTLGCEPRMTSQPEIKWYHENKKINDNMIVDDNHIIIRNVTRHDSGPYQCLAEDGSEEPPIAAINVIVNYAPEIEVKKDLVHSGLGVESELMCIVHAHPHGKVSWLKNQAHISSEKGRIEIRNNKTLHSLHILHTKAQDFGEYTCVASNNLGRATKNIILTGVPSQPFIYAGETSQTGSGLILKWRLESYSPITEYTLQYRRKDEKQWTVVKPTVTNGRGNQFTVEYLIDKLEPGPYEAILMAKNDFGWSRSSVPHVFTKEYIIQEAENIQGSAVASQPFGILIAFLLVVSSCAFRSL